MSIVYILTNECMPEVIKIGITENLESRMKQLDNTSVALSFECFYAVQVENAEEIERLFHQGLDDCRVRPNREFFYCEPERAKSLLKMTGGIDVTPEEDIVESPQDQQALEEHRRKRKPFNFQILNIEPGTILQFAKDHQITCAVVNEKQVEFEGEITSLSASANKIMERMNYDWGGKIQGPAYWCLEGEKLSVLRQQAGFD